MDTYETLKERRSIRRYKDKEVPKAVLKKCINAARLSPSAANLQPLRFITIRRDLSDIFECTAWAGYLDWEPTEEEMPRAYIAILKEKETGWEMDAGIAAQSICLTVKNEGLGSCILGAIDKEGLKDILSIPEGFELKLLVGMGYPDEKSEVIEDSEDLEYHYEDDVLKVPKKPLDEVWIEHG